MRLIDADELILHLNDFMLQQSPIDIQDIESIHVSAVIQDCINAVEEQPTAYDVNKVVNKLEMSKKTALDLVKLPHFFIKSLQELVDICFDRAIEIVKAGDEQLEK